MIDNYRPAETLQFDEAWVDPDSRFPIHLDSILETLKVDVQYGGVYKDEGGRLRLFTITRHSDVCWMEGGGYKRGFTARFDRGKSRSLAVSQNGVSWIDKGGDVISRYLFLVDATGKRSLQKVESREMTSNLLQGFYCDDPKLIIGFVADQWIANGVNRSFVYAWKNVARGFLRAVPFSQRKMIFPGEETIALCKKALEYPLPDVLRHRRDIPTGTIDEYVERFAARYLNDFYGKKMREE